MEPEDLELEDEEVLEAAVNDKVGSEAILSKLEKRVGQVITVGDLNSVLQTIFAEHDTTYLLPKALYNMDTDETQELTVFDDTDMYIIKYDIVNLEESKIKIVEIELE